MSDSLRTVDVRLPKTWRIDRQSEAVSFALSGVDARPESSWVHDDGRSKLVVFSVRMVAGESMEVLREGLRRDLMAESGHASGDALAWVSQIDGEYFPAILRTPSGGGQPLVWLARLPEDTVPDRMPEIISAMEAAEWVYGF